MRFVCLLVEHLPTRVETSLDPDLASKSIVILRGWDERVLDASPDVIAIGVGVGDSRRRVEQLCPQAIIIPAHEETYQSQHDALRLVLLSFANGVETFALGELFIEVGALMRAFPSEAALALHLMQQVEQATHLPVTLSIASNKFTAAQAARQATEAARIVIVPDGYERRFLEPLPLKALPNPPAEMLRRLHLFGITTLGSFAQLPHAAVALQSGSDWNCSGITSAAIDGSMRA